MATIGIELDGDHPYKAWWMNENHTFVPCYTVDDAIEAAATEPGGTLFVRGNNDRTLDEFTLHGQGKSLMKSYVQTGQFDQQTGSMVEREGGSDKTVHSGIAPIDTSS